MNYIVYNSTTGVIISTGFNRFDAPARVDGQSEEDYVSVLEAARASALTLMEEAGQTAMEGSANPASQKVRVSDGVLIQKAPDPIDYAGRNRRDRSFYLAETDFTQFADSPLTSAQKALYATYRQALRDLPSSVSTFSTAYLEASDMPVKP